MPVATKKKTAAAAPVAAVSAEDKKKALDTAAENISADTLDLVSIDIKEAYNAIGEITGNTTSEEIIDAIFKKFCLGK